MPPTRLIKRGDHYYDLGTKNKSFIQVAKDLQTLGIKNCFFMLELYDRTVATIDPYACDENGHTTLTQDQISRVCVECYRNPWYYLREIARIPDPGGTAVSYIANRGNIAQAWCILHGIDSWLCLPRQQGKTQSALAILTWGYNFGTSQSQFIFIHKDGEGSKNNLRRLSEQIRFLPEYMRFESYVNEDGKVIKGKNNATEMKHSVNGNSIITKAKATGYDSALSIARGLTSQIQYFDEPEFTNFIDVIISNSVSTYETAARRAKENSAMYARIFTCTPGDLDTAAGKASQTVLDHCAKWTEKLYDAKSEKEIEDYIKNSAGEECNGIVYIEYQYYQIGLSEAWLKNISAKINDPLVVRREILLQRLHGSSDFPYDISLLEYIVESTKRPIPEYEIWLEKYYKLDVYKKLNKNIPYIIGVDCSTGTNSDFNAFTVIDPYTVEPVAEFRCSYVGETIYEKILISLVQDYLPRAVLCIERNSMGDGIIDHLMHSPISNRLYFDKDRDLVQEKNKQNETVESILKRQAGLKKYYGVYTKGSSRDAMFSILSRHVAEYPTKFITQNIISDLSGLVKTGSGKIEAGPGGHDDSIMSYLIALYVYYHGNNLPLFGIIKGSEVKEDNSGLKQADEIDPTLVNPKIIEEVKRAESLENENTWVTIMKDAMIKSQRHNKALSSAGLINNGYDNGDDDPFGMGYEESDIPMDFFDEINDF